MSGKGLDFKHKEVINIKDGRRLGYVQDVTADLETGVIKDVMVTKKTSNNQMFIFNREVIKNNYITKENQ